MNRFTISGRLTKDITVETKGGVAVADFAVAIDRAKKDGKDAGADFPRVTLFGKSAENAAKFTGKGKYVIVEGHIQTGSYEKDGKKVFTTNLIGDRIEFVEWKAKDEAEAVPAAAPVAADDLDDIPW